MAVFIELLLIGVGLSMDAFAVSICKGLAMRRVNKKQAFVIGLFFWRISGADAVYRLGARHTV